jgi:hypothetical protein
MAKNDFTVTLTADQSPQEVFRAIKNVRGWWSGLYGEEFKGNSEKLNDEFIYTAGEGMHYSKQKLVELVPGKKIVWLVTESNLTFLKDKSEWTNTRLSFEISPKGNQTFVRFTHEGLVPDFECYETCSTVWTTYIREKLADAIRERSRVK